MATQEERALPLAQSRSSSVSRAPSPPVCLGAAAASAEVISTSAERSTIIPIASMPAPRMATYSTATSIGDDAVSDHALVHNFDLSKYKDGQYRLIPASAREQIKYTGRFLHHGPLAKRKSKVNTVQFDWPGVAFELTVRGTNTVAIRLKGDGNYFNVFVNGAFRCILKATLNASCCEVATELDPESEYTVTISKRTEPQMRGKLSTFKVCTFYGFIVEADAEVLPIRQPATTRKIEFIGDSDTCAWGNEGKATSAKNMFGGSMKGRMENVYNGYACILARMFDAEAHILAWSGKGVHSNAADWGPSMPALWKNTIASREGEWEMQSWMPDIVVVNLGSNDLFPPASLETEIVGAYALFLAEVRSYRPNAQIFCVAYDEGCMSAEDSEINRIHVSLQLQEIVKVAMSKVNKHDPKMHYAYIKVRTSLASSLHTTATALMKEFGIMQPLQIDGGLVENDYATQMHYAVSGHLKIAARLSEEIGMRTHWRVEKHPNTMPYPQEKNQILMPKDSSNCTIC
ncbi:Carbohydrate esterase, partial [Globisporangium splendens]